MRPGMSWSSTVPTPAIIVVAAVAVMLSAPASAKANPSVSVSFDGHLRAVATFIEFGDWFQICDHRRDGLPVAVRFSYIRKDGSIQRGIHWHAAGVEGIGNSPPPDAPGLIGPGCSFGNHDFGEGRRVWFQACVRHADGHLQCGRTEVTRA
jgi:hypothetical protein